MQIFEGIYVDYQSSCSYSNEVAMLHRHVVALLNKRVFEIAVRARPDHWLCRSLVEVRSDSAVLETSFRCIEHH